MTDETNTPTTDTINQLIQSEGIKLIRGQRGGYGWEIKVLNLDIDRLKGLNDKMIELYGGLLE